MIGRPSFAAALVFLSTAWADDAPKVERRYAESLEPIVNPERGFYAPRMSDRMTRLDRARGQGISLVLLEVDLRDFRDREISAEKLDEVRAAFAEVRKQGLKAIVRAAYGYTGRDYRVDPKDMSLIEKHIGQLGSTFVENRDVLAGVQAGFLGPWGEWHGSNWGDPPSLEARKAVLFALLDAVPSPVSVQIRRPMFVRDIFEGAPELTEANAYDGSKRARTGWHDDALLSLPSDMGTYAQRGWDRDRELDWCASQMRFAPFGGETVPTSVKTPVDQVVRELERLHATYLNTAYHRGTLQKWRDSEHQGENAFAHVERRLGYRFVADALKVDGTVKPAGELAIELALRNVGFASPHLPREVAVVLRQGDRKHRVVLADQDPRRWFPEAGAIHVRGVVPIPADLPAGAWSLSLHLADPATTLRDDGRYAIRLANTDIPFEPSTGENLLIEGVTVAP